MLADQEIIPQKDAAAKEKNSTRVPPVRHSPGEEMEAELPDTPPPLVPRSRLQATRVVLDDSKHQAQLSGGVRIEQLDGGLLMVCDEGTFRLGADNRLQDFRLQGNVLITQPGRVLSSDLAFSRDDLQTIVLVGNARVRQPGAFDLTGERLEVLGEPGGTGAVRSETPDRPVSLSLKMGSEKQSYELTPKGLQQLRTQGLPPSVTARLTPLLGHHFASREEYSARIRTLLGVDEANRHMEAILGASH